MSSSFARHSSGASTANMGKNYFIKHYGMEYFGEAKSAVTGLLGLTNSLLSTAHFEALATRPPSPAFATIHTRITKGPKSASPTASST